MLPNRECVVYPTARCIREAAQSSSEPFLPSYLTMGEFISRAVVDEGKIVPDEDLRLLALHEASDFSAFSNLQIERNFFAFIQNSEYIFRFFEELAYEAVSIASLREVDVYGEYEEHLRILEHLRERYRQICERNGWSERIFAAEEIHLQSDFLSTYERITLHIEGYLSRYELELLRRCAKFVRLEVIYTATPFNKKMTGRFGELGFNLEENVRYRLLLEPAEVLEEKHMTMTGGRLECETFSGRIAQIGFIKAKVEAFIKEGIDPEKIAVVLPDEGFASLLRAFDPERNFNFAMGEPFADTPWYREIENLMLYLDENTVLNRSRIEGIDTAAVDWMRNRVSAPFKWEMIDEFVTLMAPAEASSAQILEEEMHRFSHLGSALEGMSFFSVLRIFMNRLRNRSIDDVGGGKVTVMGVLETRGIAFEGVVVADFNEGYVPHKSEKDLFLNTKTRDYASLPTTQDRESLQKHYYAILFRRAKRVALSCVQNAEAVPSRFLLQLGISLTPARFRYEELLFEPMAERPRKVSEYAGEYDFCAQALSASSLKSFLSCKRQFYYRYVRRISEHEIPVDLSQERDIGNVLHRVLESVYASAPFYASSAEIRKAFEKTFETDTERDDAMQRHMKRLWIEKMEPFFTSEEERFAQGWRVAYREKESSLQVGGIMLTGRIDRIDARDGKLMVIDYKSGKYPDTTQQPKEDDVDYQLSIYSLLASQYGEVEGCAYYDLGNGSLMVEGYLEEKNDRLREILAELSSRKTWEWKRCEDMGRCRFCPYVYLCNREAMHGV